MKAVAKNTIPEGLESHPFAEAVQLFPLYFKNREVEAAEFIFVPKQFCSKEVVKIALPGKYEFYLSKNAELCCLVIPDCEGEFEIRAYLEEGASFQRATVSNKKTKLVFKSRYTAKKSAKILHAGWTQEVDKTEESIVATIEGEGAEVDLLGGWHLCDRETIKVDVLVEHKASYARSNQLFKGVVEESARSSFEGSIFVAKGAHKTESFQKNNNIVFDQAQARTSPGIQVFHYDVKATHGATIAKPSKEDQFYLLSRGFSESRAKALLIESFLGEIRNRVASLVDKRSPCKL